MERQWGEKREQECILPWKELKALAESDAAKPYDERRASGSRHVEVSHAEVSTVPHTTRIKDP